MFYFKDDILYVNINGEVCTFKDLSIEIWNCCQMEIDFSKPNHQQQYDLAVEKYGKEISMLKKQVAVAVGGEFGIKIIREMTKTAVAHLQFVIQKQKEAQNRAKTNRMSSHFVEVEITD
jgi:predicted DsbA family dithiol-disulfide isomerase